MTLSKADKTSFDLSAAGFPYVVNSSGSDPIHNVDGHLFLMVDENGVVHMVTLHASGWRDASLFEIPARLEDLWINRSVKVKLLLGNGTKERLRRDALKALNQAKGAITRLGMAEGGIPHTRKLDRLIDLISGEGRLSKYKVCWKDGTIEIVEGTDIVDAIRNSEHGADPIDVSWSELV